MEGNTFRLFKKSLEKISQLNMKGISKRKINPIKIRLKNKTKLETVDDIQLDNEIREMNTIEYRLKEEFNKNKWSRNLTTIVDLLKILPNFTTFIQFYLITDESLRQFASMGFIKTIQKDEILFNIDDQSDAFYIIIEGTIVIREKLKDQITFQDKISLSKGKCFGEFGLLYSIPRSQTCVAVEQTTLISLLKDNFNKIFKKAMMKAESDRKMLVGSILPSVTYLSQKKFLSFYKHFFFMIYKKNDIILRKGDIADSIFLIQYGKCRLMNDDKHILTLGVNELLGLEAIDNNPCIKTSNINEVTYNYSVYCEENCTIMKIRLNTLGDLYYQLRTTVEPIKKTKESIISKYVLNAENCLKHQKKMYNEPSRYEKNVTEAFLMSSSSRLSRNHHVSIRSSYMKPKPIVKAIEQYHHKRVFSNPENTINFEKPMILSKSNKKGKMSIHKSSHKPYSLTLNTIYGSTKTITENCGTFTINTGSYDLPLITLTYHNMLPSNHLETNHQ